MAALWRWAGPAAGGPGRAKNGADRVRELTEQLADAQRRMQELATTDDLTGLCNRRHFNELLERELERVRRHGTPLALAIVDIDYLQAANDNYGHPFCDRLLARVAGLLRQTARTSDILARCSGDDFLVLMPNTTTTQAVAAAERMRGLIGEYQFTDGQRAAQVTASLGVGCVDSGSAIRADSLFRMSDAALGAAKHAGGNCTRTWKDADREEPNARNADIEELRRRVANLSFQAKEMFFESIWSLVQALEARDPYTRNHSENVMRYAVGITGALGLPSVESDVIRRAAMVHDVGKIGIPDAILGKPQGLTPDERRRMQQHSVIGVQILDQMRFLDREIALVRHHHERWDGSGYPDGLTAHAIPFGARVLAVADSFDAITSRRIYRPVRSVPEALRILREESGRQFDPAIVDAMTRWVGQAHSRLGKAGEPQATDLLNLPQEAGCN